jgi:hypothetical protein
LLFARKNAPLFVKSAKNRPSALRGGARAGMIGAGLEAKGEGDMRYVDQTAKRRFLFAKALFLDPKSERHRCF